MPNERALTGSLPALDARQAEAVRAPPGPLLVLAGAGSGKTRVVTERAAALAGQGGAEAVLAITFTNRAAEELRARLAGLIGQHAEQMTVGTFHAVCHRMLRRHARRAGRTPAFSVYDAQASRKLLAEALEQAGAGAELPLSLCQHQLGQARARLLTPAQYRELGRGERVRLIALAWERYLRALDQSDALDFDELLVRAVALLGEPDLLARYQAAFGAVLVDEYQDTNHAQHEWLRRLCARHRNLTAVADDDQCVVAGTPITMADGSTRPVERVRAGDLVRSAIGFGRFAPAPVVRIHSAVAKEAIRVALADGRHLTTTPEHTHFAGFFPSECHDLHMTYLMYRRDMGFRVGSAAGVYNLGDKGPRLGVAHHCLHERADGAWVLSTHTSTVEARYAEALIAARYGLPTVPFRTPNGAGAGLVGSQPLIDRLFATLDTATPALRLLAAYGLDHRHPDHRPQGYGWPSVERGPRRILTLTLCADPRGRSVRHRLTLHGSDRAGCEALERVALKVTRLPSGRWKVDYTRKDYGELLRLAERIRQVLPEAELRRVAVLAGPPAEKQFARRLPLTAASQLRAGMSMVICNGTVERIVRVERVSLRRRVYDLDVAATHNYVAGEIVTHNSIYGWRGAEVENVLSFERDYPGARVLALERNYRSSGAIVGAGARLVVHNERRSEKTMWTAAPEGVAVAAIACADEADEARQAAVWCRALIERGTEAGEIAVLYRTRGQARLLEDALLFAGVPCRVVGGQGLWESATVRDLTAHLTLLVNGCDRVALARALGAQPGVGAVTLARVIAAGERHGGDLVAACQRAPQLPGLRKSAALATAAFGAVQQELARTLERDGVGATCVEAVVRCGLAQRLGRERAERGDEQLEQLRRFCRASRHYEQNAEHPTLADFLAQAALSSVEGDEPARSLATLSTLHGAKGAEWDHVRITGMCEGLLPHRRAVERGELDEERRLAYVGITRARSELTLSWPQRREGRFMAASRFLAEAGLAGQGARLAA